MGFFSNLFRKKPSLPKAPLAPADKRIYLRKDDLIWKDIDDVRRALGSKVIIKGLTVDLDGHVLYGGKIPRSGNSQSENALGVEIRMNDLVIKNGWVDNFPGGLSAREDGITFTKLRFVNIGEDAISSVGTRATGTIISGCEFWNAGGDKAIQLNEANKSVVTGCKIVGGVTGIRFQKESYKTPKPICILANTTFIGCDTAVNANAGVNIRATNNTFTNIRLRFKLGNGAKVASK